MKQFWRALSYRLRLELGPLWLAHAWDCSLASPLFMITHVSAIQFHAVLPHAWYTARNSINKFTLLQELLLKCTYDHMLFSAWLGVWESVFLSHSPGKSCTNPEARFCWGSVDSDRDLLLYPPGWWAQLDSQHGAVLCAVLSKLWGALELRWIRYGLLTHAAFSRDTWVEEFSREHEARTCVVEWM